MKISIPFYKQNKIAFCGPTSLRMVAAHFGKKISAKKAKELARQLDSGGAFLEGVLLGAHDLGFDAFFYATNLNLPDRRIPFFKKMIGSKDEKTFRALIREIKKKGIKRYRKKVSLSQLLSLLSSDSIPIVTVNTRILYGKPGFNGHYLSITGYDQNHVYAHNSGLRDAMPFFKMDKKVFEKAWESNGSNRNVILIKRNRPKPALEE